MSTPNYAKLAVSLYWKLAKAQAKMAELSAEYHLVFSQVPDEEIGNVIAETDKADAHYEAKIEKNPHVRRYTELQERIFKIAKERAYPKEEEDEEREIDLAEIGLDRQTDKDGYTD